MADLTKNPFVAGVITETLVAAAASQTVPNLTAHDFLCVLNGSGASITLTLEEKVACNHGHASTDAVITIAAAARRLIWPAAMGGAKRFRNTTGQLELTWSATTDITVGAFTAPL